MHGDLSGVRVALSVDLGGAFQVEHAVADVIRAQAAVFEGCGASVEDAHPVLHGADADERARALPLDFEIEVEHGRMLSGRALPDPQYVPGGIAEAGDARSSVSSTLST